ncbi:MAG: PKD domain-containing protein [Flavobacteriales bacterium]|nr:PKD domain-containing protein [Flavobacteriales bacterium]
MKKLYSIIFILVVTYSVHATITVQFRADTTKACAPAQINFFDLSTSTNGSIVYWKWDFGNGGQSGLKNPSRAYPNSGFYTVTLTVSDGIDTTSLTKTNYLQIFKSPTAKFTFTELDKCKPILVQFSDKSTAGDAPINRWEWDYGDLTTKGSVKNPTHSYSLNGTYSVILKVFDVNGCSAEVIHSRAITVKPPIAAFSGTNLSGCQPPLTSSFTNTSTGKGNLSYLWIFGDGATDTTSNPSHTYTVAGSYTVKLVVTDTSGCKDTLSRVGYVNLGQTKADFRVDDTLCTGTSASFINLSQGASTYLWTFSTLGSSTVKDPFFTFPVRGSYVVKLVSKAGVGCVDSISKTVYVDSVHANFTFSQDSICSPEFISFKDSSFGNIKTYRYSFTVNGTQVIKNTKNFSYRFPPSFCTNTTYQVTLTVTGYNGCQSTVVKTVGPIWNSRVQASAVVTDPCAPTFANFTKNECLKFKPISYSWNFGTGNPADTSAKATPDSLQLTGMGKYTGRLLVIDSAGCKLETSFIYQVGEIPKPNFSWFPDTICRKDSIQFTNLSTDTTKITSYLWVFGGVSSTKKNPKLPFTKLGWNSVKLTAYSYGCQRDTTVVNGFWVSGPEVKAGMSVNCVNPLAVQFTGTINGGHSRQYWSFGDTNANDTVNLSPSHLYGGPGTYAIKFWAINDTTGCKDSVALSHNPAPIQAVITPAADTLIQCAGSRLYSGSNSVGAIGNRYFWDFGNGSTADFKVSHNAQFPNAGQYTVRLVVMSVDSCTDTAYKRIHVYKPEAAYSSPAIICNLDSVQLIDTSKSQLPINSRSWVINGIYFSNDSIFTNKFDLGPNTSVPKLNYRSANYNVMLTVRDSFGCVSTITKRLTVEGPEAEYTVDKRTLCKNDSVKFQDSRSIVAGTQSVYYFGDGDTALANTISHIYKKGGYYLSKYVVRGSGCVDSMLIPIDVQGIDSVGFWATLTDTSCYPATTFFSDVSSGDSIRSRTWDFGDGNAPITSPAKDSLTKTYFGPGLFTVKLIVETAFGCRDSAERVHYINVKGPYARYTLQPDSICVFGKAEMRVDTVNQFTKFLEWDFANGRLDSTDTNTKSLIETYTTAANLLTVLIFSDSNRTCTKFDAIPLTVLDLVADFNIKPDTLGCSPFQTSFEDKSQRGSKWNWDFGNGKTSSSQNPNATFTEPRQHQVRLIYENSLGCKDTMLKSLTVLPLPVVKASADTIICLNDSAHLLATGAFSYLWNPVEYLKYPTRAKTGVAPPIDQEYRVLGTDTNGCTSKDSVLVRVIQEPILTMPADTTVIIGEEFVLKPIFSKAHKWLWTPPDGLSCTDCKNPFAQPLIGTRYKFTVSDSLGCFSITGSILVNVSQKFSVDVPDAFTPNGDGENDLIFPNGWGLKEILEFKIFNRWGELVFEASPSVPGWDGYYKGELQNMDTYIYYVRAEGFDNEVHTKEGYITLLR